jgi:hypothetical protein
MASASPASRRPAASRASTRARGLGAGHGQLGGAGRLHQRRRIAPVVHQLLEALDRLFRGIEHRRSGLDAQAARLGHARAAQPAAQHRAPGALDERQQGGRDPGARHQRRGCVDQEHGVDLGRVEQDRQGVAIAVGRRVADDVDRIRARP